ncbi:MAG: hypothetical protein HOV83_06160, partial [Catenulispora sp.]|nr:hypothetical protein [Catenulispora sp.]
MVHAPGDDGDQRVLEAVVGGETGGLGLGAEAVACGGGLGLGAESGPGGGLGVCAEAVRRGSGLRIEAGCA